MESVFDADHQKFGVEDEEERQNRRADVALWPLEIAAKPMWSWARTVAAVGLRPNMWGIFIRLPSL
jgi:hypothetical protein